ncbi:SDR family NAD(P)-dependent oxidoreductase [Lignipirellula cremea]|uniref:3-oxoacyl-[acyl-carrier-protein] reductase FabG n=1 Tax=Lignipirellula cremea TaxID=2528010 RepID=A0A518DS63_9BACT|nr:SDR family oxidoreductase [Lignipirellula cremea]QDU94675.1 3-oxoacyl-[acyl-carrier-protein] reductase FabG [Lignipirellula cremea]
MTAPVMLVTGSGRDRLGRQLVDAFADQGYAIALHYHSSAEEAQQAVQELRDRGVTVEAYQANVAEEGEVEQMIADVVQRFGRIDLLACTASIWPTIPLEQTTAADVLKSFEVNTLGSFLCAKAAGLAMTKQPTGGSIVLFGDWAIERPYKDHAAYFIAKGAIPTLTRMLAVELAERNPQVRVNCIHPGPVLFPPGLTEAEQQESIDSTLVKTANCPDAIVQAVQLLASNPMMTGVCLPVDGGRTIFARE